MEGFYSWWQFSFCSTLANRDLIINYQKNWLWTSPTLKMSVTVLEEMFSTKNRWIQYWLIRVTRYENIQPTGTQKLKTVDKTFSWCLHIHHYLVRLFTLYWKQTDIAGNGSTPTVKWPIRAINPCIAEGLPLFSISKQRPLDHPLLFVSDDQHYWAPFFVHFPTNHFSVSFTTVGPWSP